jgi:hypothetical protein
VKLWRDVATSARDTGESHNKRAELMYSFSRYSEFTGVRFPMWEPVMNHVRAPKGLQRIEYDEISAAYQGFADSLDWLAKVVVTLGARATLFCVGFGGKYESWGLWVSVANVF